eukprot:gene12913-15168_t
MAINAMITDFPLLGDGFKSDTPCSASWITCSKTQDHVTELYLPKLNATIGTYQLTSSLAQFTVLTKITQNTGWFFPSSLWAQLTSLPLTKLYCFDSCINDLPAEWGTLLPPTLTLLYLSNLSYQLPASVFDSNINELSLPTLSPKVTLPDLEKENYKLNTLWITYNNEDGIPDSYLEFNNLTALTITTYGGGINYDRFDEFQHVSNLNINIDTKYSENVPQKFPLSIYRMANLTSLKISGDAYTAAKGTTFLDFTNNTKLSELTISRNPSLFATLTADIKIVNLPAVQGITLDFNNLVSFPINIFNYTRVSLSNNLISATLPTGNYTNFKLLTLKNNSIQGTVPRDACYTFGPPSVAQNNLTGDLPSCFTCSPTTIKQFFAPGNNFTNFNSSAAKIGCKTFKINPYTSTFPTIGGEMWVTGYDLGYGNIVPIGKVIDLRMIKANELLRIIVPSGTGVGLNTSYSFHDKQTNYTFTYGYIAPTISALTFDLPSIYINGSNFGEFSQVTNVTINNVEQVITSVNHTLVTINATAFTYVDETITVNVTVNGQSASSSELYLVADPVINKPFPDFYEAGNAVTLNGIHFGDSVKYINLTIGACACAPTFTNNTMIKCTLMPGCNGTNEQLSLVIDSRYFFTASNISFIPTTATTGPNSAASLQFSALFIAICAFIALFL